MISKKCKFCKVELCPLNPGIGGTYTYGYWMCYACPVPVKYSGPECEFFSLTCCYNNRYYILSYSPKSEKFSLSYISVTPFLIEDGIETPYVELHAVLNAQNLTNITPQNIKQKLATILTFL